MQPVGDELRFVAQKRIVRIDQHDVFRRGDLADHGVGLLDRSR